MVSTLILAISAVVVFLVGGIIAFLMMRKMMYKKLLVTWMTPAGCVTVFQGLQDNEAHVIGNGKMMGKLTASGPSDVKFNETHGTVETGKDETGKDWIKIHWDNHTTWTTESCTVTMPK